MWTSTLLYTLSKQSQEHLLHCGYILSGCIFPLLVLSRLLLFHSQSPAAEWKGSLLSMPSSPLTDPQGQRVTLLCRLGAQAWADSQAQDSAPGLPLLFLCVNQPLLFCQASCLHLDVCLCHSAPSLCLARGQVGKVPAGVWPPLWAASWSWVGVGRTLGEPLASPMPEAAGHALASPSFSPSVN